MNRSLLPYYRSLFDTPAYIHTSGMCRVREFEIVYVCARVSHRVPGITCACVCVCVGVCGWECTNTQREGHMNARSPPFCVSLHVSLHETLYDSLYIMTPHMHSRTHSYMCSYMCPHLCPYTRPCTCHAESRTASSRPRGTALGEHGGCRRRRAKH